MKNYPGNDQENDFLNINDEQKASFFAQNLTIKYLIDCGFLF